MKTFKLFLISLLFAYPCFSQTAGGSGNANKWTFPGLVNAVTGFQIGGTTLSIFDPAFSSMWYHGAETTTTINTISIFEQITKFDNVGVEDGSGHVVGNVSSDDFTITPAGTYEVYIGMSFKNASGSNKNLLIVPKVVLATPLTITNATNTDPIVVTISAAHGLKNGDMVTITSVGGNAAANTDIIVANIAPTTFECTTLAHANIAGTGAYTSGGTVNASYPGSMVIEAVVSGSDLERGFSTGLHIFASGDILELAVANITDGNNVVISQVTFRITRIE